MLHNGPMLNHLKFTLLLVSCLMIGFTTNGQTLLTKQQITAGQELPQNNQPNTNNTCGTSLPTGGTWTGVNSVDFFGVGITTNTNVTITALGNDEYELSDVSAAYYAAFGFNNDQPVIIRDSCNVITIVNTTAATQFNIVADAVPGSYNPVTETLVLPWFDQLNSFGDVTTFTRNGDAPLEAPTTQASNINFDSVGIDVIALSWTNGNGTDRLVIASESTGIDTADLPVDSLTYVVGDTLAGGIVIAVTTDSSAVATGLQASTTYSFTVIEFNQDSTTTAYNTSNLPIGSAITDDLPAVSCNGLPTGGTWTGINQLDFFGVGITTNANVTITALGNDEYELSDVSAAYYAAFGFNADQPVIIRDSCNVITIVNTTAATQFNIVADAVPGSYDPLTETLVLPWFDQLNSFGDITTFTRNGDAPIEAPSVQASNITFGTVGEDFITVNWTNGNGTDRLVVARAGSPIDSTDLPIDSLTYTPGDTLGGGTVVANTSDSTATATGLQAGTTYYFTVIEYNQDSTGTAYNTSNLPVGVQATDSVVSVCNGLPTGGTWTGINSVDFFGVGITTNTNVTITSLGNDEYELSDVSAAYYAAFGFNADQPVIIRDSCNVITIVNTTAATQFNIIADAVPGSYDPATETLVLPWRDQLNSFSDVTTFTRNGDDTIVVSAPTVQASNIVFDDVQQNQIDLSWTNGNGSNRVVVLREGQAFDTTNLPVDGLWYAAGDTLLGGIVVDTTTGSSITATGLTESTEYFFTVIEFNLNGAPLYLTTGLEVASDTTLPFTVDVPTIAASNISFGNVTANSVEVSFSPGNGSARLVLARENKGVNGNFLPVANTTYTANSTFGAGDNIGPNFVVANGADSSFTLTGLNEGSTYHFAVIEYNTALGLTTYLTAGFPRGDVLVVGDTSEPTVQVSNLQVTSANDTEIGLSWTPGNGQATIILARENKGINRNFSPADGTGYTGSDLFGEGDNIGGINEVFYIGTDTMATITGLTPGATYHFAAYTFNSAGAFANYKTDTFPRASADAITTIAEPVDAVTGVGFSNVTDSSMTVTWTKASDGEATLVLVRQGKGIHGGYGPADDVAYVPSTVFAGGGNIGPNEVAYSSTGTSFTLTGLSAGTDYHFAFVPYNSAGGGAAIDYQNADFQLPRFVQFTTTSTRFGNSLASQPGTTSIFGYDGQLHLRFANEQAAQGQVRVYNLDGRLLDRFSNTTVQTSRNYSQYAGQLLIVHFEGEASTTTQKVLIR